MKPLSLIFYWILLPLQIHSCMSIVTINSSKLWSANIHHTIVSWVYFYLATKKASSL